MKRKKYHTSVLVSVMSIMLCLVLVFSLTLSKNQVDYQMKDSKLVYGLPEYSFQVETTLVNNTEPIQIERLSFEGRPFLNKSITIYALLFTPQHEKNLPAIIFLPGAGVTSDATRALSTRIALQGYAVLVLDQRGVGQTAGPFTSMQEDYEIFSQRLEPLQHLMVFDALQAVTLLKQRSEINTDNIALMGESMGGRYAMIAASLDKRVKGVIVISSAGYTLPLQSPDPAFAFLKSIDPDTYVASITPRQFFMLHGTNDSVISLASARHTFGLAQQPKEFFAAEGCAHGLCTQMEPILYEDLKKLFE